MGTLRMPQVRTTLFSFLLIELSHTSSFSRDRLVLIPALALSVRTIWGSTMNAWKSKEPGLWTLFSLTDSEQGSHGPHCTKNHCKSTLAHWKSEHPLLRDTAHHYGNRNREIFHSYGRMNEPVFLGSWSVGSDCKYIIIIILQNINIPLPLHLLMISLLNHTVCGPWWTEAWRPVYIAIRVLMLCTKWRMKYSYCGFKRCS